MEATQRRRNREHADGNAFYAGVGSGNSVLLPGSSCPARQNGTAAGAVGDPQSLSAGVQEAGSPGVLAGHAGSAQALSQGGDGSAAATLIDVPDTAAADTISDGAIATVPATIATTAMACSCSSPPHQA